MYSWSSEAPILGNVNSSWAPVHRHGISGPNEAVDLFALPGVPSVHNSPFVSDLPQDDVNAQSPMQLSRLEPVWNNPTTCPIESGPEQQTAVPESDNFWDLPSPSDDGSRQHSGTQSRYTTEHKLIKNREAQRRFRQRHKARSHDVKTQLAATTAELEELRSRQQHLEARNLLLEKISYLSSKQPNHASLDEGHPDHGAYSAAQPFVQHLPSITISLPGQQRTMSLQEASQLSLHQFAALYTDYTCEIGACLLQLRERQDSGVQARMQTLTLEALTLTGRTMLTPANHRAIVNGRLDDASPVGQKPGKAFYQGILVVLNLSESQVQDLLFIRRLNLTKRCVLSAERTALMQRMAASEAEALENRCDHLQTVSLLTAQLQQNTAEDRQVYYKLARALYRGVLSSQQLSEAMVHAYPYIAVVETLLDTLAEDRGAPTKDEIVAAACLNPMTAEWAEFVEYVARFDSGTWYQYVPVLQHSSDNNYSSRANSLS